MITGLFEKPQLAHLRPEEMSATEAHQSLEVFGSLIGLLVWNNRERCKNVGVYVCRYIHNEVSARCLWEAIFVKSLHTATVF